MKGPFVFFILLNLRRKGLPCLKPSTSPVMTKNSSKRCWTADQQREALGPYVRKLENEIRKAAVIPPSQPRSGADHHEFAGRLTLDGEMDISSLSGGGRYRRTRSPSSRPLAQRSRLQQRRRDPLGNPPVSQKSSSRTSPTSRIGMGG